MSFHAFPPTGKDLHQPLPVSLPRSGRFGLLPVLVARFGAGRCLLAGRVHEKSMVAGHFINALNQPGDSLFGSVLLDEFARKRMLRLKPDHSGFVKAMEQVVQVSIELPTELMVRLGLECFWLIKSAAAHQSRPISFMNFWVAANAAGSFFWKSHRFGCVEVIGRRSSKTFW